MGVSRRVLRLGWRILRHLWGGERGLWRGLALREPAPRGKLGAERCIPLPSPDNASSVAAWRQVLEEAPVDWVLWPPTGKHPPDGLRLIVAACQLAVRGPGFARIGRDGWLADPRSVRRALDVATPEDWITGSIRLDDQVRARRPRLPGPARIMYLIPGTGLSGGTAICIQHARRLRARGHDVTLVDTMGEGHGLDWFPGFDVPLVPLHRAPAWPDAVVATGWQTADQLDMFPDQTHVYFVQSDESRFTDDPRLKRRIAATYRRKARYLTEARWIQTWLRDHHGQEALLVPNGLDPDIVRPDEPLAPRGSRPRILLEGPIAIPFKGMADAFAAVSPLDAEVWCVSSHGEPGPGQRCDRFFGKVAMGEMRRIYSSCDVFLKMSRVEGFFGPPLEMMACGAGAVVVGAVTGHDEYIVDGHNALVVPQGDVAAARAAVQRLLDDPELRASLVAAGLRTASQWPWEPTIETLERFYAPMTGSAEIQE